jgi:Domain of unknown function (DUF5680)
VGNATSDRDALVGFLLQAKRATYAAQGDDATVAPLVPGSKQLEYRAGDYLYRDIYLRMAYFVGQEVVAHRDRAVWSMSYAGGMTRPSPDSDARAIYGFLRLALQHGHEAEPYRGPATFVRGVLTYTNACPGTLDAFWGVEEIVRDRTPVYECRYSGGTLR